MQQRTEILKMLYRDNEILIFDEPTAVLTPQEIDELMQIMKNLAAEGKSILFISHKLEEVLRICDEVTVVCQEYTPSCFMRRNRYMAVESQRVIAVYDGRDRGGTLYTMRYAHTLEKEVRVIEI